MRILIRVVLWPVRMALSLLEWVVLFVGIGCYLMAGFCFLVAVAGWLMGLATVEDTLPKTVAQPSSAAISQNRSLG